KSFASQGGRIVFIGEWLNFYTQAGIDVENGFLSAMGVQMTNLGAQYDCIDASGNYAKIPKASIRLRQVTDSVSSILLACASAILPGSNAVPLFYDTTNQHLLAAVAYPDYTPLPGPFNGRIATQSRGTIPVPHVRGTGGQR
ncbi:MAG TPA: hypothetical protein VEG33_06180, partial [Streptosporangiaceae bacterium]|nr:hypothetical protein [Streptosporangiaceae bacterium]